MVDRAEGATQQPVTTIQVPVTTERFDRRSGETYSVTTTRTIECRTSSYSSADVAQKCAAALNAIEQPRPYTVSIVPGLLYDSYNVAPQLTADEQLAARQKALEEAIARTAPGGVHDYR